MRPINCQIIHYM